MGVWLWLWWLKQFYVVSSQSLSHASYPINLSILTRMLPYNINLQSPLWGTTSWFPTAGAIIVMAVYFGWDNIQNTRDRFGSRRGVDNALLNHHTMLAGIIWIFANYNKAYGIRGYEAKTLIIKERINHPGHAITSLVWSQPHNIL
jgi:hypothetical protein